MTMTIYECDERQFMENIRRLLAAHVKPVINRCFTHFDDSKYGLSYLPDEEFKRFSAIAWRKGLKSRVSARTFFLDEYHHKSYDEGSLLHSWRRNSYGLSLPYIKVEYIFSLWGEKYEYAFDVLYQPKIRLERRKLPIMKPGELDRIGNKTSKSVLVHTLNFLPPSEESLFLPLPQSVIVLDVKRHGMNWYQWQYA